MISPVSQSSQALATCEPQDQRLVGGRVSRMLYATGYYISFSVTWPSLMIANLVPAGSTVRQGLSDGAYDAAEARHRIGAKVSQAAGAAGDKIGEAYSTLR